MAKLNSRPRAVDLLAIRESILDYLAEHSTGRQGAIAEAVGLRREKINLYVNKRQGLTNIEIVQKLQDWMLEDMEE